MAQNAAWRKMCKIYLQRVTKCRNCRRVTICNTMDPREKLAASLQGFFRSVSGSSDRELASTAIRLEADVIALVKGKPKNQRRRRQTAPAAA
jgi:hypothetical protein